MTTDRPDLPLLYPQKTFTANPGFRVAVVFDDSLRTDTTGRYCVAALQAWAGVAHFRPPAMHELAGEAWDLFLHVDDGLNYVLPPTAYPAAWWVIDTHLALEQALARAPRYDWVFCAQREGAQRLRQAGLTNVWWLPLAATMPEWGEGEAAREWDWAFVGHWEGPLFAERARLLQRARTVGRGWAGQCPPDEMMDRYRRSRVVLNPPVRGDVNMRVFEAMAAGAALLTENLPDLERLGFEEGVHYLGYRDADEAVAKLEWSVCHPEETREIGRRGRELVRARHTYRQRMGVLLQTVGTTAPLAGQYYLHPRQEILALVPPDVRHVLDVGCAAGALGAALKARQACRVSGIEPNPRAAAMASEVLDEVRRQTVEEALPDLPAGHYDCIVLADVLEHTTDPWRVLRALAEKLAPNGIIVLSIPNVAHWSVVRPLLRGEWRYETAGILDHTHLRFFTPSGVGRLLAAAGLVATTTQAVIWKDPDTAQALAASGDYAAWSRELASVYQIICVAQRRTASAALPDWAAGAAVRG